MISFVWHVSIRHTSLTWPHVRFLAVTPFSVKEGVCDKLLRHGPTHGLHLPSLHFTHFYHFSLHFTSLHFTSLHFTSLLTVSTRRRPHGKRRQRIRRVHEAVIVAAPNGRGQARRRPVLRT